MGRIYEGVGSENVVGNHSLHSCVFRVQTEQRNSTVRLHTQSSATNRQWHIQTRADKH